MAGLVPWWLTGWEVETPLPFWAPLRVVGVALIVLGALALLWSFLRFALEGVGTPAPVAPTERLVVGGLYRYVRNPMYVAVTATIVGQALLLGQLDPARLRRALPRRDRRLRPPVRGADAARALRRGVRRVPPRRPGLVAAAPERTDAVGSRSRGAALRRERHPALRRHRRARRRLVRRRGGRDRRADRPERRRQDDRLQRDHARLHARLRARRASTASTSCGRRRPRRSGSASRARSRTSRSSRR